MNKITIEMSNKLSELRRRVFEAFGANHYLLRSIDLALTTGDRGHGQVSLDAINGQPEPIWRKLMNGWKRPSFRPGADELRTESNVELVLDVTARQADETSSGAVLDARTDFKLRDDPPPVRIEILEGTSKVAAVALIRAVVEKLDQEWEHLTTQTPRFIADMEDAQSHIAYLNEMDWLHAKFSPVEQKDALSELDSLPRLPAHIPDDEIPF
jgi:hypothetical protein